MDQDVTGIYMSSFLKRQSFPTDCLTETPNPKILHGFKKSKQTCVCDVLKTENYWNQESATTFHSQLKHEKFQKWRHELSLGDTLFGSEYLVGKSTHVKLCLMKDKNLDIDERVILLFISGENELRFPAVKFLEIGVPIITKNLLSANVDSPQDEMKLMDTNVYVEFFADSFTKWICFREYIMGYVSEKLFFSAFTWVEFKRIVPMILSCANYNTDIVLQEKKNSSTHTSTSPSLLDAEHISTDSDE